MENKEQYDFVMDVFQDFIEIESMTKILKDSVSNENNECSMSDIGNVLEILNAKIANTKNSLNKFINDYFSF